MMGGMEARRKKPTVRRSRVATASASARKRTTTPSRRGRAETSASREDPDVIAFLNALEHPLSSVVRAVREIILGASPAIREGIKWNVPSFRTTEYFATFHLRAKDRVSVVLHTGAKVKGASAKVDVPDPAGLLDWRSGDRCLVTLDGDDLDAKRAPLRAIIKAWIAHLPA
jgi:hypothetical protein